MKKQFIILLTLSLVCLYTYSQNESLYGFYYANGIRHYWLEDLTSANIIVRNTNQDELHLQFSPDVTPTQVELYDMQGRLVKTQRNGLENLNLEELSAGAYTMRVTLEDGKVFSDKVVKE